MDLYVSTPPLEAIKMILTKCAGGQRRSEPFRAMVVDVKRANFYAKAQRPMYIEIPEEDRCPGDGDKVACLEMSLNLRDQWRGT